MESTRIPLQLAPLTAKLQLSLCLWFDFLCYPVLIPLIDSSIVELDNKMVWKLWYVNEVWVYRSDDWLSVYIRDVRIVRGHAEQAEIEQDSANPQGESHRKLQQTQGAGLAKVRNHRGPPSDIPHTVPISWKCFAIGSAHRWQRVPDMECQRVSLWERSVGIVVEGTWTGRDSSPLFFDVLQSAILPASSGDWQHPALHAAQRYKSLCALPG
jgi:hypothetical protein